MTKPFRQFWSLLLGLFGLYAGGAAAQQGYLCFPSIDGGNTSKENAGCMDVLSWGMSQSYTLSGSPGSGQTASTPSFEGFTFTKPVDRASDDLLLRVFNRAVQSPDTVEYREYLACASNCTATEPFLTINLHDARVVSMSNGGGAGTVSTESVTLDFSRIDYCFRPVNQSGGLDAPQCASYNRETNTIPAPL